MVTVQASCGLSLTQQHERGGAVFVDVRSGSATGVLVLARVPLAVWYPVVVAVAVDDGSPPAGSQLDGGKEVMSVDQCGA